MASLRRSSLVFRVAGMAGVLRAEGTSSEGSEEDRGREKEKEKEIEKEKDLFYSRIKVPIRTLSFALWRQLKKNLSQYFG